jgi:hypothetical protein
MVGIVLLIVAAEPPPTGLRVWLDDGAALSHAIFKGKQRLQTFEKR